MRSKNSFLLMVYLGIFIPVVGYGESLLKAASFPKTFEDVSFSDQIKIKAEGYEPFADLPVFDVLTIINTDAGIAEEIAANEADTANSVGASQSDTYISTSNVSDYAPDPSGYCATRNYAIPANQMIPVGKPVLDSDYKFCSRYGYRKIYGKNDPHYGFDIGCTEANFGNPVFATAGGTVEKVSNCSKGSSAGNYILINHQNGFKTYYMHLEKILVSQGQQVTAGCQIGVLGYTGGAKANKAAFANEACPKMRKSISHVHYEIHYIGDQTSVVANGKNIPIKHGYPTHKSIDPSYFMDVPQHMQ